MDGAGKVYILGVHEITLVEKSRFHRRFGAEHHETTAEVRRINRTRQIKIAQLIAFIAPSDQPCGQETTAEHIEGRRQTFGQILQRA